MAAAHGGCSSPDRGARGERAGGVGHCHRSSFGEAGAGCRHSCDDSLLAAQASRRGQGWSSRPLSQVQLRRSRRWLQTQLRRLPSGCTGQQRRRRVWVRKQQQCRQARWLPRTPPLVRAAVACAVPGMNATTPSWLHRPAAAPPSMGAEPAAVSPSTAAAPPLVRAAAACAAPDTNRAAPSAWRGP